MTDKNDDKSLPHSSAFGFLFEGKNNEFNDEYKDFIEDEYLNETETNTVKDSLLKELLADVQKKISKPAFSTWFEKMSIEDLRDDYIILGTNTTLVKEWLEQRYKSCIQESLKSITNVDYKVSIVLRHKENINKRNEEPFTIEQCVICNCKDLLSNNIELPFNVQGIVSMTVECSICTNCGEIYYSETIKRVIQLFKQREHERRIKPIHLQSKEYRISSAEADRDDQED